MRAKIDNSDGTVTSDAELIGAFVREKKAEAFEQLVERYQNLVYRTCYRVLSDAHLAEDVSQEVFLLLLNQLRKGGFKSDLGGWLYRAAVNRALVHSMLRGSGYLAIRDVEAGRELFEMMFEDYYDNTIPVMKSVDRGEFGAGLEVIGGMMAIHEGPNRYFEWILSLPFERELDRTRAARKTTLPGEVGYMFSQAEGGLKILAGPMPSVPKLRRFLSLNCEVRRAAVRLAKHLGGEVVSRYYLIYSGCLM